MEKVSFVWLVISIILFIVIITIIVWPKNKWYLVREGVIGIKHEWNPFIGYENKQNVIYDVFRRKKRNGIYSYRKIER